MIKLTEIFLCINGRLLQIWSHNNYRQLGLVTSIQVPITTFILSDIGTRPIAPIQSHDCWLLNPYNVTDRIAFGF